MAAASLKSRVRNFTTVIGLAFLTAASSLVARPALAQDIAPTNGTVAGYVPVGDRQITIHPADRSKGQKADGVYFLKPVLAFVEKTPPLDGMPSIILGVDKDKEFTYLDVGLIVSSKTILEAARNAIIEQDPELRDLTTLSSVKLNQVIVKPWPLKQLRLEARHLRITGSDSNSGLYGEGISDNLEDINFNKDGTAAKVTLKIPNDRLTDFLAAIKANQVKFVPSYTFQNTIFTSIQKAATFTADVKIGVEKYLTTHKIAPGAPLTQEDLAALSTQISQSLIQTIRTTDAALLTAIGDINLADQIIKTQAVTLSDLQNDNALTAQVKEYLLATLTKVTAQETTKNTITKKQEETRSPIKLNLSSISELAGGPPLPISDIELTPAQKDELENTHDVTLVKTAETNVFAIQSIKISSVRKGWQTQLTQSFQAAYVGKGADGSFLPGSVVSASFTVKELERNYSSAIQEALPFSGILPGMAFCSFRQEIPPGFVKLDGSVAFPNEKWVAESVRGKKVPDMKEKFVVGAQSAKEVGTENGGKEIEIGRQGVVGERARFDALRHITVSPNFTPRLATENGKSNYYGEISTEKSDIIIMMRDQHGNSITQSSGLRDFDIPIVTSTDSRKIDFAKPDNQPPFIRCQWIMRMAAPNSLEHSPK